MEERNICSGIPPGLVQVSASSLCDVIWHFPHDDPCPRVPCKPLPECPQSSLEPSNLATLEAFASVENARKERRRGFFVFVSHRSVPMPDVQGLLSQDDISVQGRRDSWESLLINK